MSAPHPAAPSGPVWTAAAVAQRLGVAPGTLRSWARRYGIGPAAHSPGAHRRYTADDIAELEALRALVAQGMLLPAAAAAVRHQRTRAVRPAPGAAHGWTPGPNPGDDVADLLAAAARLDHDTAGGIVAAAVAEHGVVATWERLCRPALREIDTVVDADRGCTDSQLALSRAISTRLRSVHPPPADEGRPVLLACAPGEQHTLGVDVLFAALTEQRVPARLLTPAVPSIALLHAARALRPVAVVVWSQRTATARPTVLRRVAGLTSTVLAAGSGWRRADLPEQVVEVDDLRVALGLLARAHSPGSG